MFKVKWTPYREGLGTMFHRQTKNHKCESLDGRYQFFIGDDTEEADFWIVQGKGSHKIEKCRVAPENVIFLATEPRSILVYPNEYLQQFGHICTCQDNISHPNTHLGQAVLPWFVGYKWDKEEGYSFSLDYDILSSSPCPQKTKLISVITSDKAFTQGHIDRIRFVEKLKAYYGDQLDVFGRGICDFDDKWDVLAPYKYHISIENSSQKYYWTEKISDCYLAETFPFYYGCTNLADYFDKESFIYIDINNFEQSVKAIDQAINTNRFERSQQLLHTCKQQVLNEYNMFEHLAHLCDTLNPNARKEEVSIQPCRSMKNWTNFCNYTFTRNFYKMKFGLTELIKGKSILKQP